MAALSVQKVWKEYDGQVVLENLNLEIPAHEFVTVVGASGCGKSTFLRMLLGVEKPTRGQFLLDGQPLPDEPGPDRGIVFQRYSLFPHLDVTENLLLPLELRAAPFSARLFGAPRRRAIARAHELLQDIGLYEARDRFPYQLSGGMQQRLSIAQSVISEPKLLLLDEPFGALDPGITADMHRIVLELWRRNRMTIFMVTHDIKEGFTLGTRMLVFDRPRYDDRPPESYGARITYDMPLKKVPPPGLPALGSDPDRPRP